MSVCMSVCLSVSLSQSLALLLSVYVIAPLRYRSLRYCSLLS